MKIDGGPIFTLTCTQQELARIRAALSFAGQYERRIRETWESFKEAESDAVVSPVFRPAPQEEDSATAAAAL